jgi:hypothetical protein
MTDDDIIKAAYKIQVKRAREEKLRDATGKLRNGTSRQEREVTLQFEAVIPDGRVYRIPAVSFQVPYELACAFAIKNEEIV